MHVKLYSIPKKIKTFIFDIDGTLYTSPEFVAEQVDVQIRHYAHINGISEDSARNMIESYRKKWSAEHGGKKISLGKTFPAQRAFAAGKISFAELKAKRISWGIEKIL